MLKNAYFLAKIGADTAENEQHFAEILPIGRSIFAASTLALERRLRDEKSKSRRLELEMHDVQARTSDVWAWCVL